MQQEKLKVSVNAPDITENNVVDSSVLAAIGSTTMKEYGKFPTSPLERCHSSTQAKELPGIQDERFVELVRLMEKEGVDGNVNVMTDELQNFKQNIQDMISEVQANKSLASIEEFDWSLLKQMYQYIWQDYLLSIEPLVAELNQLDEVCIWSDKRTTNFRIASIGTNSLTNRSTCNRTRKKPCRRSTLEGTETALLFYS